MDTCLDTLAVALYVTVDDLLVANPHQRPPRPAVGISPQISDSEMITLAVVGALLGFTDESRWVRWARAHLRPWFPYVPRQPGYNKRLRNLAGTIRRVCHRLARSTDQWCDGTWVVDSTPVEAARSNQTVRRSDLAGYAQYGYCASHSRYFWGFRLHLVCTLSGLPVGYALTGAKADERATLLSILEGTEHRPGQIVIADKGYYGHDFEDSLADQGVVLLRKARRGEAPRPGGQFFRPLRQTVESVNATFKTHLDIEHHHGRTLAGLTVRILVQILALTTAIWHNERTSAPVLRSLTPYDH